MNATSVIDPVYDAVIVGARCAGAATALLLARSGLRVLAVDRGRYGTDTLSTHALMRGGVLQLHRWGVLDRVKAAGTPAVRKTSFYYGDEVIDLPIKSRDGVDALYAPRRTVLDSLIVDAAAAAGVTVAHGVRLSGVTRSEEGRVIGATLQDLEGGEARVGTGLLIGADGMRSSVAPLVGSEPYRVGRHAAGVVYAYAAGLDVEGYRWYYRPGVSVGVIPTNNGETCVFAAMPAQRFRSEIRFDVEAGYRRVLAECAPELAAEMTSASVGRCRGFPGQSGFFRRSWGPGWALVGDAAYFKDPITAHGLTDALRDAELLARAVVRGTDAAMAGYEAARDDLALGLFEVTDEIASFQWTLDAVKSKHRRLSDEMSREVAAIARFGIDDHPIQSVASMATQAPALPG
jgi:menaquinone-9 beta-reductase